MIKKFRYEKDKLKRTELKQGNVVTFSDISLNEPGCMAGFEEMRPEIPMKESWTFTTDQFFYVMKGKAEITYSSSPSYEKEEKIIVEAKDAYFVPIGKCATWKIIGSEAFLQLFVLMPRPDSLL